MPNVQPLYKGGDPSFPLSPSPYYSRTEDQNVDFSGEISDPSKNYQFVSYRPGFSLQASELNEIQENFQMQMSLTIAMMHNWITSGSGHQWQTWDANSPGGEGGQWDADNPEDYPPNTGIGVGGTEDGTHPQSYVVSGPGWRGATPLHPFNSPYQNGNNQPVVVTKSGEEFTFTFNPGWWLVENKGYWNGGIDQPKDISGLKHWIYLDSSIEHKVTVTPPSGTNDVVVGLQLQTSYVECGSNPSTTPPQDPNLADNATGVPNSASCGASRYAVNFISGVSTSVVITEDWTTLNEDEFKTRENMNPVCVIRRDDSSVRYMNNLLIMNYGSGGGS